MSSQKTAPIGQASLHAPHPMHFVGLKRTPPPVLGTKAPVGQGLAQGGSIHALHTITVKPLSKPPRLLTWIAVFDKPPTANRLAHANMHSWQPTQRSESITASRFASKITEK